VSHILCDAIRGRRVNYFTPQPQISDHHCTDFPGPSWSPVVNSDQNFVLIVRITVERDHLVKALPRSATLVV
jgi:hypothetical protein